MPRPNLSPIDVALLRLLQKNARTTNKDLAKAVGIAESTCLERVRSLQDRGVIVGFNAEVDLAAIGRTIRAFIHVRLQPKTTESMREFQRRVMATPEVLNVWIMTGTDDFIVDVAVPTVDRLQSFILEQITSQPNVVDSRTALAFDHQSAAVIEPLSEAD